MMHKSEGPNELKMQQDAGIENKKRHIMQADETIANEVVRSPLGWDSLSNVTYPVPSIERLPTYFKYENVPFRDYQLNAHLGQTLPLVRALPETRPQECHNINYGILESHHRVSVIILFYNELWSILLRTIHSILAHSPINLLQEIILVDDNSSKDNLKAPLESYIQWLPKIRLLRTKERVGLIRARMVGARQSKGNILVFLDAHVEVQNRWLEPLVAVVVEDNSTIAVPNVGHIEPYNLDYSVASV